MTHHATKGGKTAEINVQMTTEGTTKVADLLPKCAAGEVVLPDDLTTAASAVEADQKLVCDSGKSSSSNFISMTNKIAALESIALDALSPVTQKMGSTTDHPQSRALPPSS